jgi:hypothetical protein
MILPRDEGIDSMNGLDGWTRDSCVALGCTISIHWCRGEVSVEFLPPKIVKNTAMQWVFAFLEKIKYERRPIKMRQQF